MSYALASAILALFYYLRNDITQTSYIIRFTRYLSLHNNTFPLVWDFSHFGLNKIFFSK